MSQRFKRRRIPDATRRAVALRWGCMPGERAEAMCAYCPAVGWINWAFRLRSGRPSMWVTFTDLELDHVIPASLGGGNGSDNIVLACPRCNGTKGARYTAEQMREGLAA